MAFVVKVPVWPTGDHSQPTTAEVETKRVYVVSITIDPSSPWGLADVYVCASADDVAACIKYARTRPACPAGVVPVTDEAVDGLSPYSILSRTPNRVWIDRPITLGQAAVALRCASIARTEADARPDQTDQIICVPINPEEVSHYES